MDTRLSFLILLVVAVLLCTAPIANAAETTQAQAKPNILLVIADDFGLDASPCHTIGKEKPTMPTLQALCKQGVVFDNVWAYPVCTPTRASILTGLHSFTTGVRTVDDVLAPTQTLLHALQGAQYATAVIGKWHVGGRQPALDHPQQLGAQYYAGFLTGGLRDYSQWDMVANGKQTSQTGYVTTVLTDQAIDWARKQAQQQPWFMWLAYNAPHAPFHVPPAHLHSNTALSNNTNPSRADARAMYFAMAQAMDWELGRLLESLSKPVRDNTVVIFLGDNGTPGRVTQTPYTRDRVKGTVYQGGVQIPLVIAGPGVTRAGGREDALISSTDLFATVLALAGAKSTQRAHSTSFAPALSQADFAGRNHVLTESRGKNSTAFAIRDQQYKLIELSNNTLELYDLLADPHETRNLLAGNTTTTHKTKAQALLKVLNQERGNTITKQ
jgi:arylsulfatase B